MERSPIKSADVNLDRIFSHIFENGMGNPIIFSVVPTLVQMKANTWGIYGTTLYIKFANNTGISISGSVLA